MIGEIKYFRFLDAPHFTFKVKFEEMGSTVLAHWSSMRGEYNKPVRAFSEEQAEAMAVHQMYEHLMQAINSP